MALNTWKWLPAFHHKGRVGKTSKYAPGENKKRRTSVDTKKLSSENKKRRTSLDTKNLSSQGRTSSEKRESYSVVLRDKNMWTLVKTEFRPVFPCLKPRALEMAFVGRSLQSTPSSTPSVRCRHYTEFSLEFGDMSCMLCLDMKPFVSTPRHPILYTQGPRPLTPLRDTWCQIHFGFT